MSAEQDTTQQAEGVQSLYDGENHDASWERSYNADATLYEHAADLRAAYRSFLADSQSRGNRRALMRTYVTTPVLDQLHDLPVEAAVPVEDHYMIWIGQNQHPTVSVLRDVRTVPARREVPLQEGYRVDTQVRVEDLDNLIQLWGQFGWTPEAVRQDIESRLRGTNTNPIVLIRNLEQEAIGVMISESLEFGAHRLVELTELAVNPYHQGHGLASVLIRELARLSTDVWRDALVYGEYNVTTQSYHSAARAGQLPGQTSRVLGVLRDHVGITTGDGNETIAPFNTRWLHNFLVMYNTRNHR